MSIEFQSNERAHTNDYITSNGNNHHNGNHRYNGNGNGNSEVCEELTYQETQSSVTEQYRSVTLDKVVISNSVEAAKSSLEGESKSRTMTSYESSSIVDDSVLLLRKSYSLHCDAPHFKAIYRSHLAALSNEM